MIYWYVSISGQTVVCGVVTGRQSDSLWGQHRPPGFPPGHFPSPPRFPQPPADLLQLMLQQPPPPLPAQHPPGQSPPGTSYAPPVMMPNYNPSSRRLQNMVLPFAGEIMRPDDPLWQLPNLNFRLNRTANRQG